ncbi:MAG: signal peptidase II [Candidatus Omnitrophica bacterium]|nr:signal peptidase II [Candidatus Omnitrophota bacterium]
MQEQIKTHVDILLCTITTAMVVIIDRVTKSFFSSVLSEGETIPVIKNIFHFTLVHNTGMAFGLFRDHGFVFIVVPIIAIALLVYNIYYYRKNEHLSHSYIVAFSLILGGAIGNLIDRIHIGHVIDFLDFRVFPVFNIADSAITIGACIILIKCIPLSVKEK